MSIYKQVGGDMNPGTYGGVIARVDHETETIEIREIQPVRVYVGDAAAAEVGVPFWTREAFFDFSDLDGSHPEDSQALRCVGLTRCLDGRIRGPGMSAPLDEETSRLATAEAYLMWGLGDEGPCGWAQDVVPGLVQWWWPTEPEGWTFLADEDEDFRRDILGQDDAGEEE